MIDLLARLIALSPVFDYEAWRACAAVLDGAGHPDASTGDSHFGLRHIGQMIVGRS